MRQYIGNRSKYYRTVPQIDIKKQAFFIYRHNSKHSKLVENDIIK
jgi:hypothetical protein